MLDHDVVIIGAGPSGLCAGLSLAELGISTCILEKRSSKVSNLTRAFSVHSRTLEQLNLLGVTEDIVSRGVKTYKIPLLWNIDVNFTNIQSIYNYMLTIPQYKVEEVLKQKYLSKGGTIHYNTEYLDHYDNGQSVDIQCKNTRGHLEYHTKYMIGADGVHSSVRKNLGIEFTGERVLSDVLIADILFDSPTPIKKELLLEANSKGFVFMSPFGDGYYRVLGWNHNISASTSKDHNYMVNSLKNILTDVTGINFSVENVRWISKFSSYESVAEKYNKGNIFLVGDSAHTHSPAGGMGMNLGIQDSINLCWKIAYSIKYNYRSSLLSTYEEEMRPIAEKVVQSSGKLIREATNRHKIIYRAIDILMNRVSQINIINKSLSYTVAKNVSGNSFTLCLHNSLKGIEFCDQETLKANTGKYANIISNIHSGVNIRPDGYILSKQFYMEYLHQDL